MKQHNIPFHKPYIAGKELSYISDVCRNGHLAGNGPFTQRCQDWLRRQTGCHQALLTHSCTAAMEVAVLLLDIQPGDEIIMPSYTFVSTANAFVLRGGVPIFVDIRQDTLNLDESLIEAAITPRTRAVTVVHYAGVACEMQTIMAIAKRHGLAVIEDAAHGIMASYQGRALGSIGDLGAYSFHATKNIISGEGGSLLVNDSSLALCAEIIHEKGTDRKRFFRGEVDKYTWQRIGSSFLPGELIAAFLLAQLEQAEYITKQRLTCWHYYHQHLLSLEQQGVLRRPIVPENCQQNAHLYYLLLSPGINSQSILKRCQLQGIGVTAHYAPLHSSPGGQRYGRAHGQLSVTDSVAQQLIRLPLWLGINKYEQGSVIATLKDVLLTTQDK